MANWSAAGGTPDDPCGLSAAIDMAPEESRIARAAVVLLRGDVAVLHTGARAVLAAAQGVDAAESARQLSDPLKAWAKGYQSQLSVPLWRDGRRVGALAVLGRDARRFSDADIALLQALAGRVDRGLCSLH